MPWRKYAPRVGRYGPVYHVARGINVRLDKRGSWTMFFEKKTVRKNQTFGRGREALVRALKEAERLAAETAAVPALKFHVVPAPAAGLSKTAPPFMAFCRENWYAGGIRRWTGFTAERYEEVMRVHLASDPLFEKPVDRIGRNDLKGYVRRLSRTRSPATVETVHGVISAVFNEAVDEELLNANPASGILKSILPPKRRRDLKAPDPFSRVELERFLAQARVVATPSEVLLLKALSYAGLRLGEALAMRAEFFDPAHRTYFVCQSYKGKAFNKPKGGRSRLVDLPEFLVTDLEAYLGHLRKESLRAGGAGRVDLLFVDPAEDGLWPFSQRKVQALFARVCRAARLRVRNPHDARHTFATLLLMAHRSPAYVQHQLGHSSISITIDVYGHWIPGQGREGLEEALMGDAGCTEAERKPHIFRI